MKALFLILLLSLSVNLFPIKGYVYYPYGGAHLSDITEMKKKHPNLNFEKLFYKVIKKKAKAYLRKLGLLKKKDKK